MKKLILVGLLALIGATSLIAQDYYTSGGNLATAIGNLSVSHLNSGIGATAATCWHGDGTWGACGGASSTITFTAGSRINEIGNGTLSLQDSSTTTFGSLLFGNTAAWPKLTGSTNRLQLSRQDNAGAAYGFFGARPGSCSVGDWFIDAGTGIASSCAATTVYEPFGTVGIATSVVSGTSPSISPANNNTLTSGMSTFRINVGTGGTATQITFNLTAAPVGWNCTATDLTAMAAHVAGSRVVQLSGSTTAIVLENQTISTGAALVFPASDIVAVSCFAF